MITKIRHGVFETNSSSSHSISISTKNSDSLMDLSLQPDYAGEIVLTGGEFGWGYDTYKDALTKANYCAVDNINDGRRLEMLEEVIKEQTGAAKVIFDINTDWEKGNYSYLDHQSVGTSNEAFESKEALRQFIFNKNSILIIDNDNH